MVLIHPMTSVLLIFIDGLGIGRRNSHNPLNNLEQQAKLAATPLAVFDGENPSLPFNGICVPTDACLGVEGRPQSASGQTAILTGINAPAKLGHHKQGFPNQRLREIICQHSIFLQLKQAAVGPVAFANAYPERFFQERPRWVAATTVAVEAAGMSFRNFDDVRSGHALYHDFTNNILIESGTLAATQRRTPHQAAEMLVAIAHQHRFTLYEYFITDRIGHQQDMAAALSVLTNLACFVREVLAQAALDRLTVVLTSDHGNIEDLSLRNHTRNPVPTLAWGVGRNRIKERVRTIADITPAIVDLLTTKETVLDGFQ